jgi:hypothetical protein
MQVKMNKEIRGYSESVFFGLSMRQFIFSLLAVLVAVVLYFWLKPLLGGETVSWVCILGAVPFAAMGFINYHGMTAEKLLVTWLKDMVTPRQLVFKSNCLYARLTEEDRKARERREYKRHD